MGQYLTGSPNGGLYRPININLFRYAALNPLRWTDPTGNSDYIDFDAQGCDEDCQMRREYNQLDYYSHFAKGVNEVASTAGEIVGGIGPAGLIEAIRGKSNYDDKPLTWGERILAGVGLGSTRVTAKIGIQLAEKAVNNRNTLRAALGLGSIYKDARIAHHLIPVEMLSKKPVQAALAGGFDFNGKINGIALAQDIHNIYHNDFAYNAHIGELIDTWAKDHPKYTPAEARGFMEGLANMLRDNMSKSAE